MQFKGFVQLNTRRAVICTGTRASYDGTKAKPSRSQSSLKATAEASKTLETKKVDASKFSTLPFSDLAPEPWIHGNSTIEEAHTPPSSWYIDDKVWQYEKQTVFSRNWVGIGHTQKLQKPGDFVTGKIAGTSYLVVRSEDGQLRAFHNVCRHHAAPVSMKESGNCADKLSCSYHGWEYDLEGRFRGAEKMRGIQNFDAKKDASLVPIRIDTWGHWMFLQLDPSADLPPVKEWLGKGGEVMSSHELESEGMVHVRQLKYDLKCNWKVYADNYLDGCYHCTIAHEGLSAVVDVEKYFSEIYEKVSLQLAPLCNTDSIANADASLETIIKTRTEGDGRGPAYSFVYPNLTINRYSLWTGTILINPTGADSCQVLMDYFVHPSKVNDTQFIDDVCEGEHVVQMEDVALCDLVQEGIFSPIYDVGRYAPEVEQPMFAFHQLINKDFTA